LSSSRTGLTLEAAHGSEHPPPQTKRSARDRWLLLGLLLLILCIGLGAGIGLGIGMSSRLESATAAATASATASATDVATRVPDCEPQRERPGAIARLATPIQPEAADSAAVSVTDIDSASAARVPDPHGATAIQPTPKRRTARPKHAPAHRGAPSPALGPDLHEALRLLREAQQALRATNATRALSLLTEMAGRAPDLLVEEREVTRALAHCAAHDVESARDTAAALRAAGLARVYAHRLSESCVGPEPTPASLLDEMRQRVD
jgi:hypothetical protein